MNIDVSELFKKASLLLIILGAIFIFVAALGGVPIGNQAAPLENVWRYILVGIGAFLLIFGILLSWKESFGSAKISVRSDGLDKYLLTEFPPDFKQHLETSQELWIVGVSITTTVRTYRSVLENKLRKGHNIRVILVNPDNVAVEGTELRAYGRNDIERARKEIKTSLQDLCNIREIAPDRMIIRVINHPIAMGYFAMNPSSDQGVLYAKYYSFQTKGGPNPKLVLQSKDKHWFNFFMEEIQNLWNESGEWNCPT